MISIDSHSHSTFSDGKNRIKEMVESAKNKGIRMFTITDHFQTPIVDSMVAFDHVLKINSLQKYLVEIEDAKNASGMKILRGLEIDYLPEAEEEIRKIIKTSKIDFALGSIHTVKGIAIDYNEEEFEKNIKAHGNIKKLYLDYYDYLSNAVKSGIFDSVGHLDLIKIFNKENRYFHEDEEEYMDAVENCLKLIKQNDICVELNTSGFDKVVGVQYPSRWIIEKCFEMKIDMTIGSDAHTIGDIGRHYREAEKLLKDAGFTKIAYFENRKKKFEELK